MNIYVAEKLVAERLAEARAERHRIALVRSTRDQDGLGATLGAALVGITRWSRSFGRRALSSLGRGQGEGRSSKHTERLAAR